MAGMSGTLADSQAVLNVAVYIAALESASPPSTIEGDIGLGADYYNQFCGACHSPAAEGNPALNSPALAGTDDWYLLAQWEAFRSGTRLALLYLWLAFPAIASKQDAGFVLSEDCPPGFELAAGHCELRSLRQLPPS